MVSPDSASPVEFLEAATHWNLEKLYVDLANAKGKGLTPVEKKILRGLLCGYSPSEIANKVYQNQNSSAVRVYLSNGLYKYIQELIVTQTGELISIRSWSRVTNLLSKAGYQLDATYPTQVNLAATEKQPITLAENEPFSRTVATQKPGNWDQTIDIATFYGRTEELTHLEEWIIKDRCRVVALLGMAGMGKTALAAKLATQVAEQFEYIRWRSLCFRTSVEEVLADLIQAFPQASDRELPATTEGKIVCLLQYLRSHRCLLILDQAETILSSGTLSNVTRAGEYREGCETYGELLKRLGGEQHSSCVVLTSREKPKDIAFLEGEFLSVRSLEITGLQLLAGQELLKAKGLVCSSEEQSVLIKAYGGNPSALKIVATTIQEVFNGKVTDFLRQGIFIFGDIHDLLKQQFNRLSKLENKVLCWLAIEQQSVPLLSLQKELIPGISKRDKMETFESLRRRSLIEKSSAGFSLPLMVKNYILEKLVAQVSEDLENPELLFWIPFINPQAQDVFRSVTSTRKDPPRT
jgi:hypothetical protein